MPGALDDDHVLALGHAGVGGGHLPGEVIGDAAHDEVGREVPRQGDRRHVVQRVGQVEDLGHQHGVLVGARPVDDEVALADRLQEAEAQPSVADGGHDAQAGGGLAPVLAGRGKEDADGRAALRPCVAAAQLRAFVRRSTRSTPSRSRVTRSASIISGSRCSPSRSSMSAATLNSTSASAMKNWGSLL